MFFKWIKILSINKNIPLNSRECLAHHISYNNKMNIDSYTFKCHFRLPPLSGLHVASDDGTESSGFKVSLFVLISEY